MEYAYKYYLRLHKDLGGQDPDRHLQWVTKEIQERPATDPQGQTTEDVLLFNAWEGRMQEKFDLQRFL
jgi:hypothetical protein